MGTILIGNVKGPQGAQGITGPQGPVGPQGPTGPGADLYNGLDQTEAGVAGLDSYQGKVLDEAKLDVANVVNNLTTESAGYALDARQGKALNDAKLDIANVANNHETTVAGYALDARQGKALYDMIPKRINGGQLIVEGRTISVTRDSDGAFSFTAQNTFTSILSCQMSAVSSTGTLIIVKTAGSSGSTVSGIVLSINASGEVVVSSGDIIISYICVGY